MNIYKEKQSHRKRWPIATICFCLVYGQAYAEPLTLNTAMKLAEQYAPTLRANSARIEGAENMVSASGILPNPKLFVGLDNYPVSGDAAWSVTREGMTMQKIGVMQDFPNRAKREQYGFQGSMSKRGDCYDNAPIESFWGILKNELVHHYNYQTREEAKADIIKYIELFYNHRRIQKGLGFKTPNQMAEDFYKLAA